MENNNWNTNLEEMPLNQPVHLTIDNDWYNVLQGFYTSTALRWKLIFRQFIYSIYKYANVSLPVEIPKYMVIIATKCAQISTTEYLYTFYSPAQHREVTAKLPNKYIYAWQPMPQPYQP